MYIGISIYNRVSNLLCLSDLFFSLSVLSKTRHLGRYRNLLSYLRPPNAHHHDDRNLRRCWVAAAASVWSIYDHQWRMRAWLIAHDLVRTMVVRDRHETGRNPVKRAYKSAAYVHHREHDLVLINYI